MPIKSDEKRYKAPDPEYKLKDPGTLQKESEQKLKSFADLLESISTVEDKKKALYLNIYENALTDRSNAHMAFANLWLHMNKNPENHALHGQTLSKYIERMSKCTDQLLHLTEILTKEQEKQAKNEEVSEEEIYKQIGKQAGRS